MIVATAIIHIPTNKIYIENLVLLPLRGFYWI